MLKRQEQAALFGEQQTTPVKNDRPEAAALIEVMMTLRNHPAVAWCERQNSGAAKVGGRFIRFGWRGCSDIIGQLKDGRLLACEVKAPKGKLRVEQQLFIDQVNHAGGVAFMARNYLDVQEALQATQLKQSIGRYQL